MLFAVTDIETTGSFAADHGVTEIAVYITDGTRILHEYQTLVNPGVEIPRFVQGLTGITDEMVSQAPAFGDIAGELFALFHDKVFVAHNVNFDYSFLKSHFAHAGYQLQTKKLCTIRYARKVIPGLGGYGLDKICRHLSIQNTSRHRAAGDARATTELLHLLFARDQQNFLHEMLRGANREKYLPPNLDADQVARLPQTAGIYFFHDRGGRVIYVGKAKNIQKRVSSHFANNSVKKQKQEFLKRIYSIGYEECGNELAALIRESVEIRRHFPDQNESQKRFKPSFALYTFEDGRGYSRLFVDKIRPNVRPLFTFFVLSDAYQALRKAIKQFQLCPSLCFLQSGACREGLGCGGGCTGEVSPNDYNSRVTSAIESVRNAHDSFVYLDKGLTPQSRCCIVIDRGQFYGMGYIDDARAYISFEDFKNEVTPYRENEYLRILTLKFAEKHPMKVLRFEAVGTL